MKNILLTMVGGLLICTTVGELTYAGSKPVNMVLRVQVDGPPPCTVTGSDVDFGDVLIRRIDGSQYLQPVTYKLDCGQRLTGADDLRMQLQGPTSVINGETVLNTVIDGFGIRIQNATNDSLITVGSSAWLPFSIDNQPTLEAVPVKQNGVSLVSSAFSATATMVVDYQ